MASDSQALLRQGRWDAPPALPDIPDRGGEVRSAAVERAARAIYRERIRQSAKRQGVEPSIEPWGDYVHAVPVFANDIREQAEAALRAVGFR